MRRADAFVESSAGRPRQFRRRPYRQFQGAVALAFCIVGWQISALAHDEKAKSPTPAAEKPMPAKSANPESPPRFPEIEALRAEADKSALQDEALRGETLRGTPVTPRTPECFPAESRDIFWEMDRVPDGPDGPDTPLRSLNFDTNNSGKLEDVSPLKPHPDNERDAIRGRNTWILWAAGNEGFWNWLAQDGYGFTDLLVALDSRNRASRFRHLGVINQPGFVPNGSKRLLGLYLDLPALGRTGRK